MADKILTENQARVIGAMIEKQLTTPQYYPLTLNAVRLACNQKNNRDPVVEFTENETFDLLESLHGLGFIKPGLYDGSRTTKYAVVFEAIFGLAREETVILCELFIRGPQTPGELRSHCERMRPFKDLGEVERALDGLRIKGRVIMLERQSGTKENRWAHLFGGEPKLMTPPENAAPLPRGSDGLADRVLRLEARLEAELEAELKAIRSRLSALENRE